MTRRSALPLSSLASATARDAAACAPGRRLSHARGVARGVARRVDRRVARRVAGRFALSLTLCVALSFALTACASDDGPAPRDARIALLDVKALTPVAFADDPFAAELATPVTCAAAAVNTDQGMLEIETDRCNHVTVEGVLVDEVRAGETLRLLFWHLYLYAGVDDATGRDVVTTGHAELRIGERSWWSIQPAIPGKEAIYKPKWVVDEPIAKGTRVVFHVHNHGANSWRLVDLTTGN